MSIEENITFLEEQRRTFRAVLANQQHIVEARGQQITAFRQQVSDLRGEIRSLKETLISDGRAPSIAAVRERVQLRESVDRCTRAEDEFAVKMDNLAELSAKWRSVQTEKGDLPRDDSSELDRQKIGYWGDVLREQLRQYDFKSLDISEIGISPDTYRPSHGGFDMQTLRVLTRDAWEDECRRGFDLATSISASDFIRVIWSYLNGLREVALSFDTNHPGLLVFDEPRQQSAKDLSFEQLLRRAAQAGEQGHQVIFATSEKEDTLRAMLCDVPHAYHAFTGHVISRLSSE